MQRRCSLVIVFTAAATFVSLAGGEDLSEKYAATLDFSRQPRGFDWTCQAKDIWRLREFSISLGEDFAIQLGASHVAFGCHKTNVLWAAILPTEPGTIVKASAGQGERVTSIWLRFHPGRVGKLFPTATVAEQGDAELIARAKQIASFKMRGSYHVGPRPAVTQRNHIIVDCETSGGSRRFYLLDTVAQTVEYVDAFRGRALQVTKPLAQGGAVEIFDRVWQAFDREYALFAIKPRVNWPKLREEFRARAERATDHRELAAIISAMLDHLQDLHVYVRVDGDYVQGYSRKRPLNANTKALQHLLGPLKPAGKDIEWARTEDGIGYISVDGLRDEELPATFEKTLQQMEGTRGLILDLRFNGGGAEPLAQPIAGCFLDRPRIYAQSQFRNGPRHTDLGPKYQREVRPSKRWYYEGPVIALQGQKTMSSAEAFVLMLAQCPHVTTMGDRTAGSSGNPRQINAGAGIVVNLPRWIAMDPDAKPFETVGVQPDVVVNAAAADFTETSDPVLSAALKQLRAAKRRADEFLQLRPEATRPSSF